MLAPVRKKRLVCWTREESGGNTVTYGIQRGCGGSGLLRLEDGCINILPSYGQGNPES